MIEIKQINTGVAEIIAVKVPEGAHKFFVHPFMSILGFTKEDGSSGFIEFDQPLTGPWELLGNYTELTEEQCREVVEKSIYIDDVLGRTEYYRDYSKDSIEESTLFTAKEAFASLIQANGLYSKNPLQLEWDEACTYGHGGCSYEEYFAAQANTGTWLILVKK